MLVYHPWPSNLDNLPYQVITIRRYISQNMREDYDDLQQRPVSDGQAEGLAHGEHVVESEARASDE